MSTRTDVAAEGTRSHTAVGSSMVEQARGLGPQSRIPVGGSGGRSSSLGSYVPFLLLMTFGYTVFAIDRTVLSAVLAKMTDIVLNNSQVGLLSSAQYIGVLCTVFIAGHLSDRYGRWAVLTTGVAVFTSFTWLIGLSSSFAEAFAFRLISGFGEGVFWPVAMASVTTYFKERKGLALGIFYVGFDVGSVAGLTVGGLAYSFYGNWRPAFFIAPLIGLPVIAGALIARTRLRSVGQGKGGIRLGRDAIALIRQRNIFLIMGFALLATWASVWQVVYLPYYFFTVKHFTILSSALLSSTVAVAGAFGKVLLGGLSDRWKRNRLLVSISLVTILSYLLFFSASEFYLDMFGALSMGFFSAAIFPIMQALMTDSCGGMPGTALGLSTSSQSVATTLSPIITASLFAFGVGQGVELGVMIPAALAVVVALFLKEPRVPRGHTTSS
jgi:MFS family permease